MRYRLISFRTWIQNDHERECLAGRKTHLRRLPGLMRNFGMLLYDYEILLELQTYRIRSEKVIHLITQHFGSHPSILKCTGLELNNDFFSIMRLILSQLRLLERNMCLMRPKFNASESFYTKIQSLYFWNILNLETERMDFQIRINIPKMSLLSLAGC